MARARTVLFDKLPAPELATVTRLLRTETAGGFLLLAAATLALVWANSPAGGSYQRLREVTVGPAGLHLDLDLQHWAADGLLALFFFVVGLELKRELVIGRLSRPAAAVLPMVAAVAGMAVPALVYLAVAAREPGAAAGWAVPTATDIAFALTVLAVIGSSLPAALRAFLLTLAVVDDLGAITIIAVFYTDRIVVWSLLSAAGGLAGYAYLQRRRCTAWWLYVPLSLAVWALMHHSGVHATVAGVALGLLTRVRHDPGEQASPAERLEHRLQPLSAGVALPMFAFFSAGVAMSGADLRAAAADPAAIGVAAGLVLGKLVGVFAGTYLAARWTRAELSPDLAWSDIAGVAALAGVGFTVSLLIGDLAFAGDQGRTDGVKIAVLAGSLVAATLATVLLGRRERHYRTLRAAG